MIPVITKKPPAPINGTEGFKLVTHKGRSCYALADLFWASRTAFRAEPALNHESCSSLKVWFRMALSVLPSAWVISMVTG